MFEKLTNLLDSFVGHGTTGCDLVIYHRGECIYRHFTGLSDEENNIPMNGRELYNLYSCSKVITVTAALILWERGAFELSDKLEKYMPEFANMMVKCKDGEIRPAEKSITVEDLFCMTAGLDYATKAPEIIALQKDSGGRCATRDLARYLAKRPLVFEPGTSWQYSHCHDVLAALVEVISGKRFGKFVKENIFDVCGMKNSTFLLESEKLDEVCPQYWYDAKTKRCNKISPEIYEHKLGTEHESGGAGCISTVDDCIKFAEALRTGKLLKQSTIDMMTTDRIADRRGSFWMDGYGYGLGVRCAMEGTDVTSFGWGGAAGAELFIDRANELSFYFGIHTLRSPVTIRKKVLPSVIYEALGIASEFDAEHNLTALQEENAKKYGQ